MTALSRFNQLGSVLAFALIACPPAQAAFRCVDVKGKVTYQDSPCDTSTSNSSSVDTSDAFSTKPTGTPKGSSRPPVHEIYATPPSETPVASGGDYTTARGSWRGPLQFQLSIDGKRDGAAQSVTAAVLEIAADGEVKGVIPGADCRISGLATQFVTPSMASLDVSLKGCKDDRFNARYGGYLTARAGARDASLSLDSVSGVAVFGRIQFASLRAVFKR